MPCPAARSVRKLSPWCVGLGLELRDGRWRRPASTWFGRCCAFPSWVWTQCAPQTLLASFVPTLCSTYFTQETHTSNIYFSSDTRASWGLRGGILFRFKRQYCKRPSCRLGSEQPVSVVWCLQFEACGRPLCKDIHSGKTRKLSPRPDGFTSYIKTQMRRTDHASGVQRERELVGESAGAGQTYTHTCSHVWKTDPKFSLGFDSCFDKLMQNFIHSKLHTTPR